MQTGKDRLLRGSSGRAANISPVDQSTLKNSGMFGPDMVACLLGSFQWPSPAQVRLNLGFIISFSMTAPR